MAELKSRRKSGPRGAPAEPAPRSEGRQRPEARAGASWAHPRTGLSLLSLGTCLGLAWFVFQQSEKFAKVERQYQLLQAEVKGLQGLQSKIDLISEKLESAESVLQEVTSSVSLVTRFEEEVSGLQSVMHGVQSSDETLTHKVQSLQERVRNVSGLWRRSLEELNASADLLKSEARRFHAQVTVQMNTAEQGLKQLAERLRDLEDSTLRNVRTVRSQEEEELLRVEEQLGSDTRAVQTLQEEQRALLARDRALASKLSSFEPQVAECKAHLPAIEGAVRSVLGVSQDLLGTERKVDALTTQVLRMEEDMLKAVSETMELGKALDGIRYDHSILKMQNELSVLKGRCRGAAAVTEQLRPGQVAARVRRLQKETREVRTWSGRVTGQQERLRGSLTALSRDVARADQAAAAAATDAGLKIAAARTDVRRISGLLGDVAALAQSVKELEEKLEAVEDRTVRDLGHLLSSSVDRTAALRQAAAANAQRIGAARQALAALAGGLDEHTARLLGLESDRAKVLKAVSFANELKPKVSGLRKDFARLEPLLNDLTLRIGRLATDLVQREEEIALLGEKIANLTVVRAEIAAVKDEIAHISDMD